MLEVRDGAVRFGETPALDGASILVPDAQTIAILGPSGSGKTTLLRAIAGLQRLDSGAILWDGDDITSVPAHRREFGLVFQDFALFPHLDVGRNVEFGLRMSGIAPGERAERVTEALARVELAGYERRPVSTLSGGQAQRVALARALAPRPRLLLFDEPLGSLDRALRERLTAELAGLLEGLAVPAVYVTHDQTEAFAVADRVVVFDGGKVLQEGTPEDVWRHPVSEAVADVLGFGTRVDGQVAGDVADTLLGPLVVGSAVADGPVRLVIRPDALHIDPAGPIEGLVVGHRFSDGGYVVTVDTLAGQIDVLDRRKPEPGERLRLAADPDGVVVVARHR